MSNRRNRHDYEEAAKQLNVELCYNDELKPGDLYLAGRNAEIKFLTCERVSGRGYVIPVQLEYPYDIHECVKIQEVRCE